jgi:hypothetical protein
MYNICEDYLRVITCKLMFNQYSNHKPGMIHPVVQLTFSILVFSYT